MAIKSSEATHMLHIIKEKTSPVMFSKKDKKIHHTICILH